MSDADIHELFSDYPNSPGFQNRATSFAAARAIAPRAGNLRERVFQAILARPCTADEAAARLKEPACSCRPRATELSKQGRIVDSGARRETKYGRPQIVWCVPPTAAQIAA